MGKNKKRKGALKNGGSKRRRYVLNKIGERDGWICFRCKQPVTRKRKMNSPWAPSLDHVKRHADGGSESHDNLRLSHRKCNSEAEPHN